MTKVYVAPQVVPLIIVISWSNPAPATEVIVVDSPSPTKRYQSPKGDESANGAVSETVPTVVPASPDVAQGNDVAFEQASLDGAVTGEVELAEALQVLNDPPQLLLTYNV